MSRNLEIPRPVVKWAGSKSSSMKDILDRMPAKIDIYHEPFFGGGSVFFALWRAGRIKRAVISDVNHEVVTTHRVIRDNPTELIRALETLGAGGVTENKFELVKSSKSLEPVDVAARFIFLNKTCFNGLYRVNKSKGEFNTSWGKHTKFTPDVENIMAVSNALQLAEIIQAQYCDVFVESDSVIYLDPPFFPVSNTANFTAYSKEGFELGDQIRLAGYVASLAQKGVHVVASNADTPEARALYSLIPGARIETVMVPRNINSDGTKRGKVPELLITFEKPSRRKAKVAA